MFMMEKNFLLNRMHVLKKIELMFGKDSCDRIQMEKIMNLFQDVASGKITDGAMIHASIKRKLACTTFFRLAGKQTRVDMFYLSLL